MKKKERKNSIKKFLAMFWQIVWKDDSLKGWLISLVFLFVVIKLIFFPLMSLATGTHLPLVIVESCSMYHQGDPASNFTAWYGRHELKYFQKKINEEMFRQYPLKNGFNKGDILFVTGVKPDKVKVGDIILFNSGKSPAPIIHRVINITKTNSTYIFSTEGDNNNIQFSPELGPIVNPLNINEVTVYPNQLVGEARADIIPYLGWMKLIFFEHSKPPSERGFCHEFASS